MKLHPQAKFIYLITSGQTKPDSTTSSEAFTDILNLIEAAVAAGINLVQIREKQLPAKVLYELTVAAVRIVNGSSTLLLVNDRADIAVGAGAHGVHLTSESIEAGVIRTTFGPELLIGVSTHSLEQASAAQQQGADFVVLGPIFETSSKLKYGAPLGLETLRRVSAQLSGFPVLAIGGINSGNALDCVRSGASGIAAISMLSSPPQLVEIVNEARSSFDENGIGS
ncbi:MAG TPA: thiamine phosphate synthase [Pyrinomonadaceae bacterium]|nr:thiamine phosphate synthase [Pyrinomonadaceae bacterium]